MSNQGQPQQEPAMRSDIQEMIDRIGSENDKIVADYIEERDNPNLIDAEVTVEQERQAGGHVGKRVVIVRAEGMPFSGSITMRDPHPEHVGKLGRVIAEGDLSVQIRLDDGTLLYGSQCWWVEVVEQGVADAARRQ